MNRSYMNPRPSLFRLLTVSLLTFSILTAPLASASAAISSHPVAASVKTAAKDRSNASSNKATEESLSLNPSTSLPEPVSVPLLPPASVTATMTGTITTDADSDNAADPTVDTISYTTTITNNTGADISGLQFTDTVDLSTTLVASSAIVAVPDSYTATVNTQLQVANANQGVLANDFNPNGGTLSIFGYGASSGLEQTTVGNSTATSQGGTVTINSDGTLTYTPPNNFTGQDTFSYTSTNAQSAHATAKVTITVQCPAITVNNPVTNTGTAGQAFSQQFTQTGGSGTITWSKTGTLPTGITLNPSTGVLSGTTTQTGSFPVTVTATDVNGCSGSSSYTLTINCQTITVTNPGVNQGTAGQAFSQTFTVTGILGTATWTETGTLPPGITLNSSTGVLSGTTTQTGVFPLTVKATDSNGCFGTSSYTLTINCQTITVTNPSTTTATAGVAFDQAFTASGILGTATWSESGTLPTGITFNTTTGHLSGTPTETGSFPITVTATDTNSCQGSSSTYTLTVTCPTITVTRTGGGSFPQGTYNVAYTGQSATASGSNGTPYTFTISSGSLPTGLSLSSSGAISGTPTATGTFNFTIKATDQYGCFGTFAASIAIKPNLGADSYSNLVNNTQEVITGGLTASPSTPFTFHSTKITANDSPAVTLTTGTFATTAGGSITIASDGTFIYTPPANSNLSSDTFTYTASSDTGSTGTPVSATAAITLNLSNRVWYVQPGAALTGDGRSNAPFNNTSSIPSLAANDIVFVYNHSAPNSARSKINLNANNTQLIGQGVSLVVNGYTLVSASSSPSLTNTTSGAPQDVVNVTGNGCTISGVTLTNSSGSLITNESGTPAGLTVSSSTLTPSGTANGISLSGVTGTVTVSGVTITGTSSGDVIKASTGTAQWNFTSSPITQTAGRALNVSGKTGGGMSFDSTSTITVSAGTTDGAITLNNNTGGETFAFSKIALTTSGTPRAFVIQNTGTVNNSDNTSTISTADSATTCGGGSCSAAVDASGATTTTTLGLTFKSISVNGSNNHVPVGIRLDTTGGSFSVIGDNSGKANGTGGSVNVPSSASSTVGLGTAYFKSVTGTVNLKSMNFSITNNTYGGVLFDNNSNSGTLSASVTGCVFTGVRSTTGIQSPALLQLEAGGSGGTPTVTANVQNSYFNGSSGKGFFAVANGGSLNVTVNQSGFGTDVNTGAAVNNPGSTITNPSSIALSVDNGASGSVDYTITNNTLWGSDGNFGAIWALTISGAVTNPGTHLSGTISGNHLGKSGTTGSGCANNCGGIGLLPGTQGTFNATVSGNTVQETDSEGIAARNSISNMTISATIHINNNTVGPADTTGSPLLQRAIEVKSGLSNGANTQWCVDVSGNTLTPAFGSGGAWPANKNWGSGGSTGIRLDDQNNSGYMKISGYNGGSGGTDTTSVQNYVASQNTMNSYTVNAVTTSGTGSGFIGGASCPLFLGLGGVSPYFDPFDTVFSLTPAQSPEAKEALYTSTNDFSSVSGVADHRSAATNSTASTISTVTASLNQQQLDKVVATAIERWTVTGLTAQQIAALRSIKFEISDLSSSYLGEAEGNRILIDRRAVALGWYIGFNEQSDRDFAHPISATRLYTDSRSAPAGHLDLLTAIMHEMGHRLGLDDTYASTDRDNLMYGYLTAGERRLPAQGQAEFAQLSALDSPHHLKLSEPTEQGTKQETKGTNYTVNPATLNFALLPVGCSPSGINNNGTAICVDLPLLHDGDSIQISFQVKVNNPPALSQTSPAQVSNFGTVTGSFAGSPVNTNTVNTPVDRFHSTTTLGTSGNPSGQGEAVTFTATVAFDTSETSPTPSTRTTPTGTVQFFADSLPLTCTENANSTETLDGTGKATCTTSSLSAGTTHSITATYSGDGNYNGSNSNTVSQQVNICDNISTVTKTADDGSSGTLRYAIAHVCTDGTVNFQIPNLDSGHSSGAYTITLMNGEVAVSRNLTIAGLNSGANTDPIKISSNNSSRLLNLGQNLTVNISNLILTQGSAITGGAIFNGSGSTLSLTNVKVSQSSATGTSGGGGIFSDTGSTLILEGSTVSSNTASAVNGQGGGISTAATSKLYVDSTTIDSNNASGTSGQGGGIFFGGISGSVYVSNSTISNNTSGGDGGGCYGPVTLINSTVSGNTANGNGGGLYAPTQLASTTVTNNHADNDGDSNGAGGGIYIASSTLPLLDSIIAGNFKGSGTTTADDINGAGGTSATGNNNLIGTGGSGGLANGTNNNQVGVADAKLGSLSNNGGPTKTHALLAGSTAIDAGTDVTTLNGDINGAATSIIVADATAIPAGVNFIIQIDSEQMTVTAKTANTLTVTRGVNSTSPASHTNGAGVNPAFDQRGTPFKRKVAGTANATATVDIGAFEVQPPTAVNDSYSTNEDTPLVVNTANGVLSNDTGTGTKTVTQVNGSSISSPISTTHGSVSMASDGSFSYTPAQDYNGQDTFTYSVTDSGGGSANATVTITINAINDAPVAVNDSYSTNEDTPLSVNAANGVLANDTDVDTPHPSLTASIVSNPSHASSFTLNSDGSFSYTPSSNYNGQDTFTYKVNDGSLDSNTATVTITINSVNDAPSFTKGADQNVFANSGAQTVNNWATNISAGPANENSQTVNFIVSNNNNGLFTAGGQPAISPTGTLSYTPATNQSGSALVSVQIHDNGGTANNGQDTSAIQTFQITVNKSNTQTTLGSSPNPSFTSQTVIFTATVSSQTAITGPPTGTVQFFDGANTLTCSNGNTSTQTLSGGQAQCQTSALSSAGSPHSITATYSGDGAFNASNSNTVTQTVKPVLNLTVNDTGDTPDATLDGICADANGKCTLRAAIQETNFATSDDTINFSLPSNSTITLNSALPPIDGNLIINGPGANTLMVQRSTAGGIPQFRIFTINSGKTVSISGLTISNGNSGTNNGGGISNQGTLTLTACAITGNSTTGSGGGVINVNGTLTVTGSTINGNTAAVAGSGIANGGTLTLINSTVSANATDGLLNNGTANLTNDTFSGNTVRGISNNATVNIVNTIVANNHAGTDDVQGTFNSQGNNLIGNGSGSIGFVNGTNGDIVGTLAAPVSPLLAPLGNYGGPVQTQALLPGSPAINAGNTANSPSTDQRNISRVGTADIGAFESRGFSISTTSGSGQATPINTAFAPLVATVTSNFSEPVQGGIVTFTAPQSGASVLFTGNVTTFNAVIDANGQVNPTPMANLTAGGPYNVTATSNGISSTATFGLTNQKGSQTIIFTNPGSKTFGDQPFTVSATGGASGNPVIFSSTTPAVCSVSGNTVTIQSAGTCTITASQAGNSNYNAAADVPQSFQIAKANQTITFGALSTKTFGDADFTVSASASSGLAVSFAATGNCTITGNTVHITGAGSCKITASQSGNTNYNAAQFVDQPFTINQAATSTAVTSSVNPSDFGQAVNFTATVTSSAGVPTGTVDFYDGTANPANLIAGCSARPLNGSGMATCTTSALTSATHTITALYSGDSNFLTSTGTLSGGQVVRALPSFSINDVSKAEGNSGTTDFTFTVALSAASNLTVTVNYATADGTATVANNDYQATSGTLTFNPGETTKTITVKVVGDTITEPDETFFVNLSGATNATISKAKGTGTILNDDAPVVQFSSSTYSVAESGLHAAITVNRLGDISKPATVDYATLDPSGLNPCSQVTGMASQRCDYAISIGTVRFAAGESQKTIFIPIVNDVYVEGPETFTITLSNPTGLGLGTPSSATVTITDDDNGVQQNPITDDSFFIRQLYIDFLDREPDPAGLQGWLDILHNTQGQCKVPTDCDRIAVALGFVRSPEFQDRGYFIYRFYVTALGRNPGYFEFMNDMARVSGFLNSSELEANKSAFIDQFMNRQEFKTLYDSTLNDPTGYVTRLLQTVRLPNHPTRDTWILGLMNGTLTRAQVLRQLIESTEVYTKYYNQAIIVMNYFAFLRRDPDAAYQQWIDIFNHSGDYRIIVNGFINSPEYPLRFGQ